MNVSVVAMTVQMPVDMIIHTLINLVHFGLNPAQHTHIVGVLLSVTSVKPGEKPHDRAANNSNANGNPPGHELSEVGVFDERRR